MGYYNSCPRCGTVIPQKGYATGYAICACGWCDPTPRNKADVVIDRKSSYALMASAVFMVAIYAHLVSWGSYAISAPFQKVEKAVGVLSVEGYHDLAKSCLNLGKFTCAQNTLLAAYSDRGDVTALAELGHIELRLAESPAALSTLSTYVQAGGKDPNAYLDYAQLLEAAGRTDEAIAAYTSSLSASGQVLPVYATTGLVKLLMKVGRYDEALARIEAFYASAENAKGYLNMEHQQLQSYFETQAKAHHGKAKHVASAN